MGVLFQSASTQYLTNTAPFITGYPFTIGVWASITAAGTAVQTIAALSDSGTTNNYLSLEISSNEIVQLAATAGGTENVIGMGSDAFFAGGWVFVIARFVASAQRRVSQLKMAGAALIRHASTVTSRNPSGLDTLSIGARVDSTGPINPWGGQIAEFWITNADIGSSAVQLDNGLVHQLAFGGPFSVPHVARSLVEYRSMRDGIDSRSDHGSNVYHGRARQVWTAVNGPVLGLHPPLPYWYQRPGQVKTQLVI